MWRAWEVDSYDGATGLTWKLGSMYHEVSAPRLRREEVYGCGGRCGEGGSSMSSERGVTG